MADSIELLKDLDEVIKRKQQQIRVRKQKEAEARKLDGEPVVRNNNYSKPKPTRSASNRANGSLGQGSTTPEGKQRASANSLKHGFFANIEKLNPQDAPVYKRLVHELRHTLHPDNPVEEMAIRELAMLSARLQRLESAEYALLCSELEAPAPPTPREPAKPDSKSKTNEPPTPEIDSRSMAAAFLNVQDALAHLHKIEVHLRRAYNRTPAHSEMF